MKCFLLKSEHLYKGTDYYERAINIIFKTQTKKTYKKTSGFSAYFERLPAGTVQALWETWMQVCKRQRARPKILSDYQSIWQKSTGGLCRSIIKREGCRIYIQLSSGTRDTGRDLSDQSGASSPQREVLGTIYEYPGYLRRRMFRHPPGCYISCQYDSEFFGIKFKTNRSKGDQS
jgi:hypothetical protein